MNFKNKIRRCEKITDETEIFDAKLQTYEYIEQHCINISIKHHCNVSKANIGLLEHVGPTMYMYVRQSENVNSKVQIQAANLQNQKFKTVFTD